MYNNNVGSIVNFTDKDIQVYATVKAESEFAELYGSALIVSEYLTRMYATVKRDPDARAALVDTIENIGNVDRNLAFLIQGYETFYRLNDVELKFGLKNEIVKKNVGFMIGYDLEGNYAPNFRPKGFGMLGKNVEISSVTACLATIRFLIHEHENNETVLSAIVAAADLTSQEITKYPKMGIKNEIAVVRAVLAGISDKYSK